MTLELQLKYPFSQFTFNRYVYNGRIKANRNRKTPRKVKRYKPWNKRFVALVLGRCEDFSPTKRHI